jgi:hypothetical protein
MFVTVRIRFSWKKKLEKLPGKLENSGKTESAFFYGNGWNDLANFFFNIRNNPYELFMQRKTGKVTRKIGKFGKN